MRMTVAEVSRRCEGAIHIADADAVMTSVVTDSRDAVPGSLFVAIVGENADGHEFARQAVERGAVAVLSNRTIEEPCIVVDDPVLALGRLAASARAEMDATVVAITGSSGKTSTKDLIAAVLAAAGSTVSPVGSFNTEVGLPLTILGAAQGTEFMVLEMGMRGLGHIAYLADIAVPDIAVVTNVGSAHIELLGSREAIAKAKGELIQSLSVDGTAVLNGDDELVRAMAAQTSAQVVLVGEAADCQVRAVDVTVDAGARASFELVDTPSGTSAPVRLNVAGRHQVANALAAAAVGFAVGLPVQVVAQRLSSAQPVSKWRMEVVTTASGITVINDAYNANPESMRAALEALVTMPGRTWAVLGEMRELGSQSAAAHEDMGRLVASLGVSRLVCVGEATGPMHRGALAAGLRPEESDLVSDLASAQALLDAQVKPGDVVLVKASRSVGLERLALTLMEGGQA